MSPEKLNRRKFLKFTACISLGVTGLAGAVCAAGQVGESLQLAKLLSRDSNYFEHLKRYEAELKVNPATRAISDIWNLGPATEEDYRSELKRIYEAFYKTNYLPKGIHKVLIEVRWQENNIPSSLALERITPPPFIEYPDWVPPDFVISREKSDLPNLPIAEISTVLYFDAVNVNIDNLPQPFLSYMRKQQKPSTDNNAMLSRVLIQRTSFDRVDPQKDPHVIKDELDNYKYVLSNKVAVNSQASNFTIYDENGVKTTQSRLNTSPFFDTKNNYQFLSKMFFDLTNQEYFIGLLNQNPRSISA